MVTFGNNMTGSVVIRKTKKTKKKGKKEKKKKRENRQCEDLKKHELKNENDNLVKSQKENGEEIGLRRQGSVERIERREEKRGGERKKE